jgi:hypothetical protein
MTTLEELVELEPEPTHGYPIQIVATSGEWRWVVELADPTAGAYVDWIDITEWYVGDRHQFGADQYMGDARARLVTVQLQIDESDLLAPWGLDTTELFGEDVELDAGLLMRGALARVVGGVTVEWLPIWTGRVETWGDASYARGQTRVHEVQVVDTLADLANVPTSIVSNSQPWDEVIADEVLVGADWSFGVDIYGDGGTSAAGIPQDLDMVAASNRMDQITDPLGLVWRSLRSGRLVVHPAPWDTTNTNRYTNPLLAVYPDGVQFSYSPEFTDVEYIADDGGQPFGVSRTVAGVLNSFIVTAGTLVYAVDDPVSIVKFGVRPFQASWILDNDPVVDDLLAARAFASVQALPLRTTIDHEGFFPALAMVDHLDPVTVEHAAADGRPTVTVVGTIRNIVEERTFRHIDGDGDATLNWQSTVQIDVTSTTVAEALLPVEDLALVSAFTPGFGGPSGAEFSWTNPTQPTVTPTEVEVRILERSLIWTSETYPGVGADGTTVNWLTGATAYTFQVRLVRRVDGVATHVSPIRSLVFVTPAVIIPTPVPDGDDTDVDVGEPPDFDPDDCELEVELQENDGDPDSWVTVDTFTDSELTDNGDGTWSLTTPIPNSFFNEGSMYRFRSREICGTVIGDWFTGTPFDPPDDWADPCTTPPALADPPYDDPDLLVYVPQVCAPDIIREAVSGIEGVHGDALAEILALIDDPNQRALKAIADPAWSDTPGGILAYGECPQTTGVTGDKTIACKVNVADDTAACVLFECAAMQLTATPVSGGGWRPGVTVYKVGSTVSLAGTTVLDPDTVYYLGATNELATGDIKLMLAGVVDNDVAGADNVATINALPIWRVGAPPESWITDCAVWDRVLAPNEMPGFVEPPFDPVTLFDHAWYIEGAEMQAIIASIPIGDGQSMGTGAGGWPDEVGTANLDSGSATYRAAAASFNNQPCADFPGSGNGIYTSANPMSVAVPYSVVIICQLDVAAAGHYILDGSVNGGNRLIVQSGPIGVSNWGIHNGTQQSGGALSTGIKAMRVHITSGNDTLVVNGTTMISGVDAGAQTFTGITVGGVSGAPMDGRVAFVGVAAGDITAHGDWAAFQAWVLSKYGVTLS